MCSITKKSFHHGDDGTKNSGVSKELAGMPDTQARVLSIFYDPSEYAALIPQRRAPYNSACGFPWFE